MADTNEQITAFMNKGTFSDEEIKRYPYHLRKTYTFTIEYRGDEYSETCFATDDESAKGYIRDHCNGRIIDAHERITTSRRLDL